MIWSPAVLAGDTIDQFDPGSADVVVLGEVHDNPHHHANQATLIERIAPRAIVFEMLTPEMAEAATPEARQGADVLADALDWSNSGWPDFALYWPVFQAAGDAPIIGAAVPRDTVRRAVSEGAAAPFPGDAARFGLDQPLDPEEQSQREAEQMAAHCDALPEHMLGGMVAAQRLRDAAFAMAVIDALDTYGAPVVLITGNGHARDDWGVPRYLARGAPDVSIATLGQLEAAPTDAEPFDWVVVTEPAEREDPCAAFRS